MVKKKKKKELNTPKNNKHEGQLLYIYIYIYIYIYLYSLLSLPLILVYGGYKDRSMCPKAWSQISNQIRCRGWDQVLGREMLMSRLRCLQLTMCCVAIWIKSCETWCDTNIAFIFRESYFTVYLGPTR